MDTDTIDGKCLGENDNLSSRRIDMRFQIVQEVHNGLIRCMAFRITYSIDNNFLSKIECDSKERTIDQVLFFVERIREYRIWKHIFHVTMCIFLFRFALENSS